MTTSDDRRSADDDRRGPGMRNLSIRRYRGLQNIAIERLAQVTLIAGANGVGKTRLLEAAAKLWRTGALEPASPENARDPHRTGPITWMNASGIDSTTRSTWWHGRSLTAERSRVIDAVRKVRSNVKEISLSPPDLKTTPTAMATTTDHGSPVPVPLRTLGSGAVRFFEIALALANTRDGLLLIEEPEGGVHYTSQTTLWKVILEGATRNGVQVLATTHSTDSIYALSQAAGTVNDDAAAYLRLEERDGELRAVEYTMAAIRVADEHNIAVV